MSNTSRHNASAPQVILKNVDMGSSEIRPDNYNIDTAGN